MLARLDSGPVGSSWSNGTLAAGAWLEDEIDVIYGYNKSNPPTLTGIAGSVYDFTTIFGGLTPDGFVSSTHFWYADDGDQLKTTMRAGARIPGTWWDNVVSFTIPNAYQKMRAFAYGEEPITIVLSSPKTMPTLYNGTVLFLGLKIQYPSLPMYYKTGNVYLKSYMGIDGYWHTVNDSITILGSFKKDITYEILGRMCHLLQDMSVPAHVNIDPHGDNPALIIDYYEGYFGTDYYWNSQNTFSQIGGYINPYQSSNPLHFLMYTTNQMANHFATQGPHYKPNNDYFGGNALPEEISYLNSLNISSFGDPTTINGPFDLPQIQNVRDRMFPQAIRVTAGLLYWFAKEAELLPIPLTGVYVSGNSELYLDQTGYWYAQPINGLEPFNYSWEIMMLDGAGYLQTYESVKKEKEKREKDKDKKKDGDITIEAVPSNYWFSVGTNSSTFSKTNNSYDFRDFKLRCTVRDGSSTTKTSNEWYVDVLSISPPQYAIEDNGGLKQEKYLAKVTENETIPKEFSLEQNYPNPFNPTTRISYSLPEASFVTLKIYDMLGGEVAVLVNENKSAGKFEVEFDASKLSSGTYVYKLIAGNYQVTKKMQFVK